MQLNRCSVCAFARCNGYVILLPCHHQRAQCSRNQIRCSGSRHNWPHLRQKDNRLQTGIYSGSSVGYETECIVAARIALYRNFCSGGGILTISQNRTVRPEYHYPNIVYLRLFVGCQGAGDRVPVHLRHNQVKRYLRRLAFCHRPRIGELLADTSYQKQGGKKQHMEEVHVISYSDLFHSISYISLYLYTLLYLILLGIFAYD